MSDNAAPSRPPAWQERLGNGLLLALAPRLARTGRAGQPEPPAELRPFEPVAIARLNGTGPLSANWFPASGRARGAVLLVHPWTAQGKSYFHRHGRIAALRAAGYHALALDLGGFGQGRRAAGFPDRDVEAGLACLAYRAPGLPLHVWGVSAGGYWAHLALGRARGVAGALFEDVSPHLLEWSWRMAPAGRPAYLFFRHVLRAAYRYLDARRHARAMALAAVAYVSGGEDRGVLPADTRALAGLAGGSCRIVPRAPHLGAIKLANQEVIALALDTFRRAEERAPVPMPPAMPAGNAAPCAAV